MTEDNYSGGIAGYVVENSDVRSSYTDAFQVFGYYSSDTTISGVSIKSTDGLRTIFDGYSYSTNWVTSTSINNGFPYLLSLVDSYKTYTVTAIVDEDNSAINRAFVNVEGDISATASSSAYSGSILGYGYGETDALSVNKNIVGVADNIYSTTTGSGTAYSGNVIGYNSGKFSFENAYYNTEMNVESSTNTIDTTGTARSEKTMNVAFYTNLLGLTPYTSLDGLETDENAVWILKNAELPELYYNCLNDITISAEIENGTITLDKTQAVNGEIVTVTATPDEGYMLNMIYVNGKEITGTTFEVEGDSEVYATFSPETPEYTVKVEADANVTAGLVNVDGLGDVATAAIDDNSGVASLTAKDGEEIRINTIAGDDYAVEAIYKNGEEVTGANFIVDENSVITLDVIDISTDVVAVTNDAEDITSQSAVVSGSVKSSNGECAKYIEYWSENDDTIITTEVEIGDGEYSCVLDILDSNTTYYYRMTEYGEVKSFTTDEEVIADIEEEDNTTPPITTTTYKKLTSTYKFSVTSEMALVDEMVFAAVYSEGGKLLALNYTKFDGDVEGTVNVPLVDGAAYAKIFVWDKDMQNIGGVERITIN